MSVTLLFYSLVLTLEIFSCYYSPCLTSVGYTKYNSQGVKEVAITVIWTIGTQGEQELYARLPARQLNTLMNVEYNYESGEGTRRQYYNHGLRPPEE